MEETRTAQTISRETPTATISSVSRPWQGTLLGIVITIDMVVMIMAMAFVLIPNFGSGGFLDTIIVLAVPFFVLKIFIVRGLFIGKHWVVATLIFLTALGMLYHVITLFVPGRGAASMISLITLGLILWAEIICLKHPFYAKRNQFGFLI